MGGCKCTFYNCGLTTATSKNLYADRETHFFHFPIRDRERCIEWAIYSNNMDFLSLPTSKIRNKVVCDFHFKENNFMNYKRERLTKTVAVPTIYIEPDTKAEVDLLEHPTNWVKENKRIAATTTYKQSEDINMTDEHESSTNNSLVDDTPLPEPPASKRIKVEPTTVRILNGNGNMRGEISFQPVAKKLPVTKTTPVVVKLAPENFTIRKFVKAEVPTKVIKPVIEPLVFDEQFETIDLETATSPIATVSRAEPAAQNEELKPVLEESLRQIAEIKEMLNKKQAESPSPARKDSEDMNITQSQFNKVQLFNGIKRYLSPSITALLRMELFAGPGREYKKDEKIICQELLQLGENSYSFIQDEWRLRLPAVADVKRWLDEKAIEEDDDAS